METLLPEARRREGSSRRVLGPRERAAQLPVLKEWRENEDGWRPPGGKAPDERIRERAWESSWCGEGATEGAGRGWTSRSSQAPEENTERGPSPDPIKGCRDPTQLHRVALAPLLAILQPPLQPVLISWFLKVGKLSHPPGPPSPTSKWSPLLRRSSSGAHEAFCDHPASPQPASGHPAQCPVVPVAPQDWEFVKEELCLSRSRLSLLAPGMTPGTWAVLSEYLVTERISSRAPNNPIPIYR